MKEKIRKIILANGADLCGFANIERFKDAPDGFSPTDILPECKTVISFAVALPKGLLKVSPRIIYGHFNNMSCHTVDLLAFETAKRLGEMFKCIAVPMPCDAPYEFWDAERSEGRGLLSIRHLALQAGLGTLGKNTLLLNERFGSMLTLGAVLIDLDLPSDSLSKAVCIEGCQKCVKSCPAGAIGDNKVIQNACRQNAFGKTVRGFGTVECNLCRTVCPVNNK